MPAILDEHQSYQDTNGKPLVNGLVYFGVAGSDPTIIANKIIVYTNRGLTTTTANPVPTNSLGQLSFKIFVPGRYSIAVEDVLANQLFLDFDAGAVASVGITGLTNVDSVSNVITGNADPTINAYIDKAQFALTIPAASTGATTLNIDTVGARPVQNKGLPIQAGQLPENQLLVVAFNSAINNPTGVFEVVSGGGDVVGISTSVDGRVVTFDSLSGKLLKQGPRLEADLVKGPAGATVNRIALFESGGKTIKQSSLLENQIGRVLQVIQDTLTTVTGFSAGTNVYAAISGLTVAITPSSTANKVRVSGHVNVGNLSTGLGCIIRLKRSGTIIGNATSSGGRTAGHASVSTSRTDTLTCIPFDLLDNPATTSARTYTVEAASIGSNGLTINDSTADGNNTSHVRTISVITVEEIRG